MRLWTSLRGTWIRGWLPLGFVAIVSSFGWRPFRVMPCCAAVSPTAFSFPLTASFVSIPEVCPIKSFFAGAHWLE